ncbi:hypothetical protein GME_12514 [Halomonas sp. TD01]|nr:hypothetical protein GME_12514 [Halomonas sp. TD01]
MTVQPYKKWLLHLKMGLGAQVASAASAVGR